MKATDRSARRLLLLPPVRRRPLGETPSREEGAVFAYLNDFPGGGRTSFPLEGVSAVPPGRGNLPLSLEVKDSEVRK